MPTGGNASSIAPSMSPDGRFVLFSSLANNLAPGADSQFAMNLFLRDRASNTTTLVSVSVNGTGGNGSSMGGQVSTNGRYVVFQSDATDLLPGDTNDVSQIFVRDLQTDSNLLVSVAVDGSWGNGASTAAAMTPDGRYVTFVSEANNLVPGDTNGIPDVFVRDLLTQTTTLVTVGAVKLPPRIYWPGPPDFIPLASPAITPDGRFIAFVSPFSGLAAGVLPSAPQAEVYLRDLDAGTTVWASSNAAVTANFPTNPPTIFLSYHPAISDDGRFVTFKTNPYLAPNRARGPAALLQYDSSSNALLLVATNALPQLFNDDVYGPETTPDGRFIAFAAGLVATNLAPTPSLYLADTRNGTNLLVSIGLDGGLSTNSASDTPVLSPDGRFVAFLSNATNLVGNAVSNGCHIYLRDLSAGITRLVDVDANGVGSSDESGNSPSLTADGRSVAFASRDGSRISPDHNQSLDVFVRDMVAGTNEWISQSTSGLVPFTASGFSSLSQQSMTANGRWVVFSSRAEDLVTNDSNQDEDVFLTDLVSGTTTLVSVGLDGKSALGGYSANPVVSSNGQFIAFVSTATNLLPNLANPFGNIYRRDMAGSSNVVVSVSADGANPGNGSSSSPAMSRDGRFVAFLSTSTDLVTPATGNGPNTFWRDLVAGVTLALTTNSAALFPPSISDDGRYVAFSFTSATANSVVVWDAQTLTSIFSTTSAGPAAISPNGARLLYKTGNSVKVADLASKTNVLSTFTVASVRSPAQWSADGRFVAFVARSNVSVGVFMNNQVCLGDLLAGTVALLSAGPDHVTGGDGPSDSPAVSRDGRYVVYRSSATDIAPGTTADSSLLLYDRDTGSNTVLNAGISGLDWTPRTANPAIDAAGQTVVFQSCQSGLLPGDINRLPDIFATQPAVTLDSDGDGIPDWWMLKYFGHPTGSASDHSRASDDADGDGFSNLQEFLTGTDPTNPASFLHLQISSSVPAGQMIVLTWPAVPGKSYQVQYKNTLDALAWQNFGNAVVALAQGSLTVPVTPSAGFYRVLAIE